MGAILGSGSAGRERRRARGKGNQAIFTGGGFTGPGGIGANFNFSGNQGTGGTTLGELGPLFQQLIASSQGNLGGLPPELTDLFKKAQGDLSNIGQNNLQDFEGLGSVFNSSMNVAGADPFALGAGVADKLRQISERKNQRLVANTFDRLKSSGMLGTTGGAGIAAELDQNLFDQDLQFDLAGLQAGQSLQQDAFGRMMGASQGREGIAGRGFQEAFQKILGGTGLQSQLFGMGQQQQQLGQAQAEGAGNLSLLPLQQLMALLSAGSTSSNSLLGSAGIDQGNAQIAQASDAMKGDFWGNLLSGIV